MASGPTPVISDSLSRGIDLAFGQQGGSRAQEFKSVLNRALEISEITATTSIFDQEILQVNNDGTTANLTGAGIVFEGDAAAIVGYIRVSDTDITNLELKAPTGSELTLDMDANATLLMSQDFAVSGASPVTINQSVSTTSSPTFANLTITSFAAGWTNAGRTVADLGIVTTVDINGGTLDGVSIGAGVAAAAVVSTLSIEADSLILDSDDAGGFTTTLTQSATAARVLTLPDVTGTLATLADVQSSDTLSEILANPSGNTTGGSDIVISAADNITFAAINPASIAYDGANLTVSSDEQITLVSGDNLTIDVSAIEVLNNAALSFHNTADTFSGQILPVDASGVTANRIWTLPDATGTIALTTDFTLTAVLAAGNGTGGTGIDMEDDKLGFNTDAVNVFIQYDTGEDELVINNGNGDTRFKGGDVYLEGVLQLGNVASTIIGSISDASLTGNHSYLLPDGDGTFTLNEGTIIHPTTTTSSGPGAVAITGAIHEITTTLTGNALTLANGAEGQAIFIVYVAETAGGDTAILTPTSLGGADTTITFNDLADSVALKFTAGAWYVRGSKDAVIA